MTVRVAVDGTIVLEGACPIEDAEPLLQCLLRTPDAAVDWRGCHFVHTAVIQILLAAAPTIRGPSNIPFLHRWIEPVLPGADHHARSFPHGASHTQIGEKRDLTQLGTSYGKGRDDL